MSTDAELRQNEDAAAQSRLIPPENNRQPVVFFDGVCALCNQAVQRLLKMDRQHRLKFAPLQGETARQCLTEADIRELKTLVVHDQAGVARYSSAVVRILWHVGGLWSFVGSCLWLIPRPIRDWGYQFVSARRYRWFGKHDACRLPLPGEREQFLP